LLGNNSTSSTSSHQLSCSAAGSISEQGKLLLAKQWTQKGPVTFSKQPVAPGSCVGYVIPAAAIKATECGKPSTDR
jgi:hypothetical protein